jgi:hypothetical protein
MPVTHRGNFFGARGFFARFCGGAGMNLEYTVIDDHRVLVGLSARETAEFERLDAQIPLNAKPVWPDTANSAVEERWLELFTRHEIARIAPHRQFGGARRQVPA